MTHSERQPNGAPALLRATNIHKSFGGQVVLSGASVTIRPGEVILLRGENGSGKTTLLNILTGFLAPDAGRICVTAEGATHRFDFPLGLRDRLNPFGRLSPELLARALIGRTWQDTRLFASQALQDNVAVATRGQIGENPFMALFRRRAVQQAERKNVESSRNLLADVGLAGREASSGDMVSLGQAKKAAIARAVRAGARILFLDEPFAGLDRHGAADVTALLRRLARRTDLTLVIVEHVFNIPLVMKFASSVWTIASGKVRLDSQDRVRFESGDVAGDGIAAWIHQMVKAPRAVLTQELAAGARLSTIRFIDAPAARPILEVRDLVVRRRRHVVVGERSESGRVSGICFALRHGDVAVMEAPNGWGKTTLVEALAGALPISRGRITLQGESIERLESWDRARRGLSVLRAPARLFPGLTVRDTLRLADVRRVSKHVEGLVHKHVKELSGGEKQRVAIACCLGRGRGLALLDEPFAALDPNGLRELDEELAAWDGAVLIAHPSALCATTTELEEGE